MTQHTPGPWHVDSIDQVRDKYGVVICRCERKEHHEYMDSKEQHANARLIASAPELLEALNHAHNSLRTFRNVPKEEQEWTSFDDDVMEAIERTIAKAEGRG